MCCHPEKYNNYQLIATGGGIAELMGWDELAVSDVMQSSAVEAIENKTVDGIEITSEDIAGVMNGGYDFTQEYAYTKFTNIEKNSWIIINYCNNKHCNICRK